MNSRKMNKKYTQDRIDRINELTGYNFELHSLTVGYAIKDWKRTFEPYFRSKNMDELGDNLENFIHLASMIEKKEGAN